MTKLEQMAREICLGRCRSGRFAYYVGLNIEMGRAVIAVLEERCKQERRWKELSPGGHPMNVVDEWGYEHTAYDALQHLKSLDKPDAKPTE